MYNIKKLDIEGRKEKKGKEEDRIRLKNTKRNNDKKGDVKKGRRDIRQRDKII